jgi:hypothetical protein
MAKVGLDLDGVYYDFEESFRKFLVWIGVRRREQCPPSTHWNFYENWTDDNGRGLTLQQFLDYCHQGVNAGFIFTMGSPFPGVAQAHQALKDAGHSLHFITDRSFGLPGRSETATRQWLASHHLHFDSITFASDKTITRPDFMIDDKLENYDAMDSVGCEVYLLDRPWNKDDGSRRRVTSLAEFVGLVA